MNDCDDDDDDELQHAVILSKPPSSSSAAAPSVPVPFAYITMVAINIRVFDAVTKVTKQHNPWIVQAIPLATGRT